MKEVTAIIRPSKVEQTKKALEKIGFPFYTGRSVNGRGKMPAEIKLPNNEIMKTSFMSYRKFIIVIDDENLDIVVKTIIDVNSTNNIGDGKIFVSDVLRSYVISSGDIMD